MLTQEQIQQKNFKLYTESPQSNTNPLGDRQDYIVLAKVGQAEYLVMLQYYVSDNVGHMKIRDFWNDPILFPEFYYIGDVETVEQFEKALALTGFETFHEIEFDKIWLYR